MTSEPLTANMIERYLCARGSRYFCGQHDGEFFYVANTRPRRLHVHLGISRWHSDVFSVRVAPTCFFPAAESARLVSIADTWNHQNREITAIVHDSSDPLRIGVVARSSQRIRDGIPFDEFATFVDRTIAAAIEFFGQLATVVELPSTTESLLRDAS
jgi:hypothetical protein